LHYIKKSKKVNHRPRFSLGRERKITILISKEILDEYIKVLAPKKQQAISAFQRLVKHPLSWLYEGAHAILEMLFPLQLQESLTAVPGVLLILYQLL
jgi:hypothetical protein